MIRKAIIFLVYLVSLLILLSSIAIGGGHPENAFYSKNNNNIFYFIVISDTHIGSQLEAKTNFDNFLYTTMRIVNPNFIINAGDLTDHVYFDPRRPFRGVIRPGSNQWLTYRNMVDLAGMGGNIYSDAPGNHDNYEEDEDNPLAFYRTHSVQGRITGNQTQRSWWPLGTGKYQIVMIDTVDHSITDWKNDLSLIPPVSTPAEIDDDELLEISQWLQADSKLTFVVGHHPYNKILPAARRDEFINLLEQNRVSIYIYGHTHTYSDSSRLEGGTLLLNVDSLWEHNRYAIVAIDNEDVSVTNANANQWPVVLITTPIDKKLGGENPYAYPVSQRPDNPIRALVFDKNNVTKVKFWYKAGKLPTWHDIPDDKIRKVRSLNGENSYLWEAEWDTSSLPPGDYIIKVEASSSSGTNEDEITVEIQSGLDLIFTIDVTGSMWDDIDAVKASATEIVNEISNKVADWRIAVVDFQDFPVYPYGCEPGDYWNPAGDWPYRAILPFSTDKTAIINAINSLQPLCGWDWPESIYSALIRSINTEGLGEWRKGVKKVVILMTDSYPHDPEPFTGYTMANVKSASESVDPAAIYPVFIGWDSIAQAYAEQIAEQTGGKVFYAPTASDVVDAILEAVEAALKAPIAEANGPYKGIVGSPITFDASGSYDPDGEIVFYEWDWDNDGVYDDNETLPVIEHTWYKEFSGTIKLRVTDNDGLTSIDTASVEVTALAITGDLDNDGDVDQNDLNILLTYRNQPASACPECDIDGNGIITVLDARKLVLMCTRPRCATE